MQLVAYGAQDIYLTGNPQITFFKVVYRRHTNFSMESIEQTWNGTNLSTGRCTATISRNGDLVSKLYIEILGSGNWATANPGANLIKTVEVEIGGQMIDRQSGQWMETWSELTQPNPTGCGQAADLSNGTLFQRTTGMGGVRAAFENTRLFVPLQFWFCRNPGLALPLIALQYHEVKIILDHQATTVDFGSALTENKLWADYIYLDTDERRRFAQVSHEYLIEQVQEQSATNNKSNDLNFNHPVKEIVWTGGEWVSGKSAATATTQSNAKWNLKLNGHDRFALRDSKYFTRVQVLDYHSGPGGLNGNGGTSDMDDSIAVYSFALKPEEHQPSGTCNFSRIDSAQLVSDTQPSAAFTVFAVNYNVLRIMSGMGGLAYSN